MKKLIASIGFYFLCIIISFAQAIQLTTWNLCNFGKSKSDSEIQFIANELKNQDVVAIQEVSASEFGAQAVAKLADELNRKGAKWDYIISDPTNGHGSERYAYLWKTSKLKLKGKGFLIKELDSEIDREPFATRFQVGDKSVMLCTIHAVPKSKNPALEIVHLKKIEKLFPAEAILIMGDFNLSQKNSAFDGLKLVNYTPSILSQKTSLKMKVSANGEKLSNEYDNIFYKKTKVSLVKSGVIHFYEKFQLLTEARKISDHIPVFIEFKLL